MSGGLSGFNKGTIKQSYSLADVTGTNENTGGLVGKNAYANKGKRGIIEQSYSRGTVKGKVNVGGLVGYNYFGFIQRSYSAGAVKGEKGEKVGGFVGYFEANENLGKIQGCFWDKEGQAELPDIFDGNSAGVQGLSTRKMQSKITFISSSWDFNDTWGIIEGNTYPFLISPDADNPVLQLDTPTKGVYSKQTGHNTLTVHGSFSDTSGGEVYILYSIFDKEDNEPVQGHSHVVVHQYPADSSQISFRKVVDIDDNFTEGKYTLKVTAKDLNGGEGSADISFAVDLTKPEMALNGGDRMTIAVGETFDDPGASAVDNLDGILTEQITTSDKVNTDKTGTYKLTYSVTDVAGNKAEVTRTVNVMDQDPPAMTLKLEWRAGIPFDPEVIAEDAVEGDLTQQVKVSGEVNTDRPGEYKQTYSISDSAGNQSTFNLLVNVMDQDGPMIQLEGDHPLILKADESYQEPGYTATDNVDGNLKDEVEVTGEVDSGQPGTYVMKYTVTDKAGNLTSVERTVIIIEDTSSSGDTDDPTDPDNPDNQDNPDDQENSDNQEDPVNPGDPNEFSDSGGQDSGMNQEDPSDQIDSPKDNTTDNRNQAGNKQTVYDGSVVGDGNSELLRIFRNVDHSNKKNTSHEDHVLMAAHSSDHSDPSDGDIPSNNSGSPISRHTSKDETSVFENYVNDDDFLTEGKSGGNIEPPFIGDTNQDIEELGISSRSNKEHSFIPGWDKLLNVSMRLHNFLLACVVFTLLGICLLWIRRRKKPFDV